MSEWLKEHAWKACVGETLPRVRIPLSPPIHRCNQAAPCRDVVVQKRRDVREVALGLTHALRWLLLPSPEVDEADPAGAKQEQGGGFGNGCGCEQPIGSVDMGFIVVPAWVRAMIHPAPAAEPIESSMTAAVGLIAEP